MSKWMVSAFCAYTWLLIFGWRLLFGLGWVYCDRMSKAHLKARVIIVYAKHANLNLDKVDEVDWLTWEVSGSASQLPFSLSFALRCSPG